MPLELRFPGIVEATIDYLWKQGVIDIIIGLLSVVIGYFIVWIWRWVTTFFE